eukprot:scaffold13496_cov84-Isochrysis_galbana.AAC.1
MGDCEWAWLGHRSPAPLVYRVCRGVVVAHVPAHHVLSPRDDEPGLPLGTLRQVARVGLVPSILGDAADDAAVGVRR